MTLDLKLKLLCAMRGWRQKELTEQLCMRGYTVSAATVGRWWNGLNDPRRSDLLVLSQVLDISVEVLVRDDLPLRLTVDGTMNANLRAAQQAKPAKPAKSARKTRGHG